MSSEFIIITFLIIIYLLTFKKFFSHNIYLDDTFQPKLHNFQIVKETPVMLMSANEPTDPRQTPEKFRGEEYTKASEIYW